MSTSAFPQIFAEPNGAPSVKAESTASTETTKTSSDSSMASPVTVQRPQPTFGFNWTPTTSDSPFITAFGARAPAQPTALNQQKPRSETGQQAAMTGNPPTEAPSYEDLIHLHGRFLGMSTWLNSAAVYESVRDDPEARREVHDNLLRMLKAAEAISERVFVKAKKRKVGN